MCAAIESFMTTRALALADQECDRLPLPLLAGRRRLRVEEPVDAIGRATEDLARS
jgi:hypothetical protein